MPICLPLFLILKKLRTDRCGLVLLAKKQKVEKDEKKCNFCARMNCQIPDKFRFSLVTKSCTKVY
jgi:hypothetical protein